MNCGSSFKKGGAKITSVWCNLVWYMLNYAIKVYVRWRNWFQVCFFLHYMLDSVIFQPVFLPLGHAVPLLWSVQWIQAPCFGWASGKHQPSKGFQKKKKAFLMLLPERGVTAAQTKHPQKSKADQHQSRHSSIFSLCSPPSLLSHKPSFTQLFPRPLPDLASLFLSTDYQRP